MDILAMLKKILASKQEPQPAPPPARPANSEGPVFGIGCSGFIVEEAQRAVGEITGTARGIIPAVKRVISRPFADGIYGKNTASQVRSAQEMLGLEQTGEIDAKTWTALTNKAYPDLFQRCLQVTAAFEGTGFSGCVGDFDGAILTYGIIGFTAKYGELNKIMEEFTHRDPISLSLAPGGAQAVMILLSSGKPGAWRACLDKSGKVSPAWKKAFATWGTFQTMRDIQVDRAFEVYWKRALRDAEKLKLNPADPVTMLLLFDTAVQNGGVDEEAESYFLKDSQTQPGSKEDLLRLADAVADSARKEYREDVRLRKKTLVNLSGTVHGRDYDLKKWGFA